MDRQRAFGPYHSAKMAASAPAKTAVLQYRLALAGNWCRTLFVLAVGTLRVDLGVHHPSDVPAGWAASRAWVIGRKLLLEHHAQRTAPGN